MTDHYICPECGRLYDNPDYCGCGFDGMVWNTEEQRFDYITYRIYHITTRIPDNVFDALRGMDNAVERVRAFNTWDEADRVNPFGSRSTNVI
jgi:hypothetical protein